MLRLLTLAAAALFALLPATAMAAPATRAADARTIQLDRISVEIVGTGSPVILIPGLSSPREVWRATADALKVRHTVYLVQVNGFAGDEPRANLQPGILDGVVAELATLIAAERLDRPAVIGHSLGGLVGMLLASRHPEAVGRLMVVDSAPFFGSLMGAANPAAIEPRAAQMRTFATAGHERARAAADTVVTADPGGIMSITPAGRIQVANWGRRADMRVVGQAMYEVMTTDAGPQLGAITARPFTVLYAAGVGEERARGVWEPLYDGSPATLVAIPESYHFITLDQPVRFMAELARFLGD